MPTYTQTPTHTTTHEPASGATQVRLQDGMVMVYVPAGEFSMGSNDGFLDEQPVHTVYLDGFWIDSTEVTNTMYVKFLHAVGNQVEGGVTWLNEEGYDVRIIQFDWGWVVESGYGDHPVGIISWYGAQAYCDWVGGRLPTEAEWEKAARGTDGRTYPWGEADPTCSLSNSFYGCAHGTDYGDTIWVGSHPRGASPYGALDLAGNVREWVADWYDESYYRVSPERNPTGPISGTLKIVRGGGWGHDAHTVRSAYREEARPDSTWDISGFRCSSSTSP
jgi:serine/threonine-protein kinase